MLDDEAATAGVKVMFRGPTAIPRLNGQATAFNLLSASGLAQSETPADGFLNECERLLGFTRFGLGCLRTELHRRQPIFSGFDTRLGLL